MGAQIINFRPKGEQSWAQSAECAKPDPVTGARPLMFPHEADEVGVRLAKDTCNRCPVRQACLDEALGRRESFGIWGGMSTAERRELLRRTARKAAQK
jgi:WhiB family redox-sensing transcriptional regulator